MFFGFVPSPSLSLFLEGESEEICIKIRKCKLQAAILRIYPMNFKRVTSIGSAYIDNGNPAAAKFASTLIRSALDATATLRPFSLHCCIAPQIILLMTSCTLID